MPSPTGIFQEAERIAMEFLGTHDDLAEFMIRHIHPFKVVAEQPALAARRSD